MYFVYSIVFGGLLIASLPYFLYRGICESGYARSVLKRFKTPFLSGDQPTIWIHAVSVGEVLSVATLLPSLRKAFPKTRFVLSVITLTGWKVAEQKLSDIDKIFFCPLDFAWLVRRAMRAVRPKALIIVETEIWPHLLREAKREGAVIILVSGRISEDAFSRYRLARWFMARFLAPVDKLCMQNLLYANRVGLIGALRDRIEVTGSLKFDFSPKVAEHKECLFPVEKKIWVCGSTVDPEEEDLLGVFDRLRLQYSDLCLVLAPRHPQRSEHIVELVRKRGFNVVRRTQVATVKTDVDVLVLDTLGELVSFYAAADYVFVGGSLANRGGHNIIEPATLAKPVSFGPYMANFADIAEEFIEAQAAVQIGSVSELEDLLRDWIVKPEIAQSLGNRACDVVKEHRGASEKTVNQLKALLQK